MSKTTKLLIGLVILLLAIFGAYAFTHQQVVKSGLPAQQGTSVTNSNVYVTGTISAGGIDNVASAATTTTLVVGDLQNTVISIINPGNFANSSSTYTLPATSTLTSFLPNIGDATTVYFINASSTVGTVTLSAGAGMTLLSASSTNIIQAGKVASVEFIRNTINTILGIMQVAN